MNYSRLDSGKTRGIVIGYPILLAQENTKILYPAGNSFQKETIFCIKNRGRIGAVSKVAVYACASGKRCIGSVETGKFNER